MITITQLPPDCWEQYKAIRLEALQTDPLAFGCSYEEEANFSESTWRERINIMWFAMLKDEPVGMIGLLRGTMQSTSHKGLVVSFWVKPSMRGKGLGKELLLHLQVIAPDQGCRKMVLDVTMSQQAAIATYNALGFRQVGVLHQELYIHGEYVDQFVMEWLAPVSVHSN